MVYFSLRAKSEQEKKNARRVVRKLRLVFGSENITTHTYEWWVSVEIENANGWIGVNDYDTGNGSRFHIHRGIASRISFDVPLEQCDTIYCM